MNELLSGKSVIFFDIGYTIDYPASGDWMFTNCFYDIAGKRLDKCSSDDINNARFEAADYLDKNHLILNEKDEVKQFYEYYRIVSEYLHLDLTENELLTLAKDRTYNMNNYVIYPDAHRVIQELSRTYRLGIISDTWPSVENQLRSLDVLQFFSFTTYSFSLGTFKPDKRMYLDALQKCGCDAKETVFIDDSLRNLEGAAELGITPVLIAANPVSDVDTSFIKIHSLSELI